MLALMLVLVGQAIRLSSPSFREAERGELRLTGRLEWAFLPGESAMLR